MTKPTILTLALLLSGCEYMQVKDSSHATTMLERSLESCHNQTFSVHSDVSKRDNETVSNFKLSCGGFL